MDAMQGISIQFKAVQGETPGLVGISLAVPSQRLTDKYFQDASEILLGQLEFKPGAFSFGDPMGNGEKFTNWWLECQLETNHPFDLSEPTIAKMKNRFGVDAIKQTSELANGRIKRLQYEWLIDFPLR